MKNTTAFLRALLQLVLLAALVLGMVVLFRAVSRGPQISPEARPSQSLPAYPPPEDNPTNPPSSPPGQETPVPDWTEAPEPTEPPTPTLPPIPTPLPTAVVTPIPLAKPPIIPAVVGKTQQPFWIIYWQDNEVWRINDQGKDKQLLLDTYKSLGQWLTGHPMWGSDCCWVGRRVEVSPDGLQLVLVVVDKNKLAYKGEPFKFSIFVFDIQSGDLRLISEGYQPVWSPEGKRIAFLNEGALWIADLESGQQTKIAEGDPSNPNQSVAQMAWSPDGKMIAYLITEPMGVNPELFVIDAQSQSPPRLILPESFYPITGISWSPDGQQLLYLSPEGEMRGPNRADHLWMINEKNGQRNQLTQDMTISSWKWSPDGKWLAINATRHYERPGYLDNIWIMSAQMDQIFRVTSAPPEDLGVSWSPDGTRLIFLQEEVGLVTISLETGEVTPVGIDTGLNFSVGGTK